MHGVPGQVGHSIRVPPQLRFLLNLQPISQGSMLQHTKPCLVTPEVAVMADFSHPCLRASSLAGQARYCHRRRLTLQWSSTRVMRTDWSTEPLASRLPSEFHPSVYTCRARAGHHARAISVGAACRREAAAVAAVAAAAAAAGTFFRCALKLLCFHSDIGASAVIWPSPRPARDRSKVENRRQSQKGAR